MTNMSLADLKHNDRIAAQLIKLISSGRNVHAFIFSGGSRPAREELGFEFSKALLCRERTDDSCGACLACRRFDSGNNEDFILIEKPKDRASIGVKQLSEELLEPLLYKASDRHVVLIKDTELMTAPAQNKLLKTLEEPPERAVLILLTDMRRALLPTVLSRCSAYELEQPELEAGSELSALAEDFLALCASGVPYYRRVKSLSNIFETKELQRDKALEFLEILQRECVRRLGKGGGEPYALVARLALGAERYIRQGQNVQYSLKQICLGIELRR